MATPIPADFHAFADNGNGRLDASILSVAPAQNLDAYILRVHNFLNAIRDDTDACRIPAEKANFVLTLLQAFFPDGRTTPAGMVPPIRVSDAQNADFSRRAVPLSVGLGPANHQIQIVDAMAALGYIFTVATPTQANPTWHNYYLPLAVLFSKCVYLLFVSDYAVGQPRPTSVIDVPVMSCVMYISGLDPTPYIFGSTWSAAAKNDPNQQAMLAARSKMLDLWRRQSIFDAGVAQSAANIPAHAPRNVEDLATWFFADIKGAGLANPPNLLAPRGVLFESSTDPIIVAYATEYQLAYEAANPNQSCRLLDYRKVATLTALKQGFKQRMGALISARIANPLDQAQVEAAYLALVVYLFTPRMCRARLTNGEIVDYSELGNPPPVPPPTPDLAVQRNAIELALWPRLRDAALQRLTDFLQDSLNLDLYAPTTPYGRCAETYGFATLSKRSAYFHSIDDNTVHGAQGIALNNHNIGAGAFTTGLTYADIDAAKGYRYPCINCQSLINPFFDVTVPNYNTDMNTIPHPTNPVH